MGHSGGDYTLNYKNIMFTLDKHNSKYEVNLQRSSLLNLQNNTQFTLSFWYNIITLNTNHSIISKGNTNGLFINITDENKLQIILKGSNTDETSITTNNIITETGWNHFSITYNGNSNASGIKLYINSVVYPRYAINNNLSNTISNNIPFQFNNTNDLTDNICNVSMYNLLLTHNDVIDMYNSSKQHYGRI